MAFLPHSTHIPFSAVPQENNIAILAGKEQKKLPAGLGACEESTGEQSLTERPRKKKSWIKET